MNYKRLSKTLSHALRHAPEQYGITLDEEGWTTTDELFEALGKRNPMWRSLREKNLHEMQAQASKQRFEIQEGKIRAFYGHSIKAKITKTPSEPPEILYHGTPRKVVPLIMDSGLKPMSRQYVHLSADRATAEMVGRRRDSKPEILQVRAKEAFDAGIAFYVENDLIWLSEPIPAEFIF